MITTTDKFAGIREIADAVLFEGYMLYPYRANDPKNRVRWQFGVLAPPGFVAIEPSERSFLQTDFLLDGRAPQVTVQVRFLHVQRRVVERVGARGFVATDSLDVGDATFLPWDEAVVVEHTVPIEVGGGAVKIEVPAHSEVELLRDGDRLVGRLVRDRCALEAELTATMDRLPGPYGVQRLGLRLANTTGWRPPQPAAPDRPDALRYALVAAHLVASVSAGAFLSLIDPPEWARGYAESCTQVGAYPVLAGLPGDQSLVLASPIILYDHPQVAPESTSQFCDATEMDEMLTLRTLTLTDTEKRYVRGSDPRGAALVHEVDNLPPELLERLHGTIRSMTAVARRADAPTPPDEVLPWLNAEIDARFDPDTDVLMVAGVPLSKGASVRLHPGTRRADAQDMFLDGRLATVEAVLFDLDGVQHLAVSLDDLVEDGFNPHGRYLYFAPDEVEPLAVAP